MSDILTDQDIAMLMADIDNTPANIVNNVAGYVCPNCRTQTKRMRVSNPERMNRKPYFDNKTGLWIHPIPMDLHLRLISEANITIQRYSLKTGFTFCFNCKTGWYE